MGISLRICLNAQDDDGQGSKLSGTMASARQSDFTDFTARRSGAALRAVRTCICRDRAVLAHDGEHCGSCALGKLPRKLWASFWRPPTVVQYHGHGASKQSNSGEPNASKRRWLVGT